MKVFNAFSRLLHSPDGLPYDIRILLWPLGTVVPVAQSRLGQIGFNFEFIKQGHSCGTLNGPSILASELARVYLAFSEGAGGLVFRGPVSELGLRALPWATSVSSSDV